MFSQEPVSIHITQKDGLPDIEFYDMLEDSKGFIWLAADKGLFRYNGKEYTNYSHPNKRGLSVFNLQEDSSGKVWCNNISGQFFYVENDSLHLFFDIKNKIKTTQLPVFTVEKESSLNISTDEGLYRVDFFTKNVKELIKIKNNLLRIPPNIAQHKGDIFFLNDSISQFRKDKYYQSFEFNSTNTYNRLFTFNNTLYFISSQEKHFTPTGKTTTGFYEVDIVSGELKKIITPVELRDKTVLDVSEVDNRIWFNTNNGTYVYKISKKGWLFQKLFLEKKYTTKVIKDNNDNHWITTLRNGVYIIPNLSVNKLRLPQNIQTVTSLSIINDNLIYGTDKGSIAINNLKTGSNRLIDLKRGLRVYKMAHNDRTNMLFICGDVESYLLDLDTWEIFEAFEIRGAKDMSLTNNNLLLVSTHDGVISLDYSNYDRIRDRYKKGSFLKNNRKKIKAKKNDKISSVRSYTNMYREDSTLYVGQIDKLYYFDKQQRKIEIKYLGKSIFATDITETQDNIVWVSTNENGIFGIKNNKVIYNYNKSNGLQTNQALKILADGNNVWVVTNKGLHFFDRNTTSFKSFSFKNEIPIQKVTDIQLYENKVYISGNSGIFIIDKSYLQNVKNIPKVYFESVIIENKKEKIQKAYTIPYHKNSFEIHFNTNFYNSKESITYFYKLREIEDDWKQTNTGVVRYPSLPSGEYTFEVKALTNKGIESAKIERIQFYVTSPFWNQWWFYSLIAIVGIMYFRITIKRIRNKQEKTLENERISKELVLSQLENLRSQMNPHFIFNVLNSIQEYIVTNDKYAASTYLAEFSKLIRMYLDHSRKEQVELEEEIKALKVYLELERNRFDDDFKYVIHKADGMNTEKLYIPSLFIQPYVENAIKHGLLHKNEKKELRVAFKYSENERKLLCTIEDNGVGREESKKINEENKKYHTSFATKANSNRVDLLNKNRKRKIVVQTIDVYNKQSKPNGTKIIISIPQ